MGKRTCVMISGFVLGVAATLTLGHVLGVRGQLTERPGNSLDNPIDVPRDLSGLSIKTPRIRVVHTVNPQLSGGAMDFQQVGPWRGSHWGRESKPPEIRDPDGVYGDGAELPGI